MSLGAAARVLAAALLALLAACGQKGPLYLPDKKPATVTPATTATTAPTPTPTPQPGAPAAPKKSDSDKDSDAPPPQ